jgi:hypothetical protein
VHAEDNKGQPEQHRRTYLEPHTDDGEQHPKEQRDNR